VAYGEVFGCVIPLATAENMELSSWRSAILQDELVEFG
jgi:hypothetical protein